ncbi:MAG: hypothetical protein HY453_02085 [Parcubacteria group bacterium]|nr:hypothetical protein [Parcubacteria group bacterium]
MTKKILQQSFIHALLTLLYIFIVVNIFENGQEVFPNFSDRFKGFFMLTLFVLSAAVTGSLVMGKPILMYLEGQKSESIKMFSATVGWLALVMLIAVIFGR